jgi:recombination protein U
MKNPGKKFEDDFKRSAEKVMAVIRLKDPGASFNINCNGCPKSVTRFSPRNICDFIGYRHPCMYLFELKSHLGKSIPFKAIVKNKRDKRLQEMAILGKRSGINSFIIFNWRDVGNVTVAVNAFMVDQYIRTADRKSIPYQWTIDYGIPIEFSPSVRGNRINYYLSNF